MGIEHFTRARDRLLRLIDEGADLTEALDVSLAALHDVTTFSWAALMTMDPETMLPTCGAVIEGFTADACAPFWDDELLAPGFNKFTDLARRVDPVATLFDATDGDLQRSPSYVNNYAPLGAADELRAAFVSGTTCWGVASLVRAGADGPFPDDEIRQVRQLVPFVSRALRAAVVSLDMGGAGAPAMLVVNGANEIENLTIESDTLLEELRTDGIGESGVPTIVLTAVTRARASRTSKHVTTRIHGPSGAWRRVTAVPMEGSDGCVGVLIEPARPADLAPILLESYDLSAREAEIVVLLARGLATKDVADHLNISVHTVRDHVKAVFAKTGVTSRAELVAQVFCEHLLEGFHNAVHRSA